MNNDETNKILREILKWQRLQGIGMLRKKAKGENLLADEKDILVYYHSDGNKSTRDLAKKAGVGRSKVRRLWKKWIDAGIAEPTEKYGGGRCKRLFELNELGVELPEGNRGKTKE